MHGVFGKEHPPQADGLTARVAGQSLDVRPEGVFLSWIEPQHPALSHEPAERKWSATAARSAKIMSG